MSTPLSSKSTYVIFLLAAILAAFSQMAWAQTPPAPGTYTVCPLGTNPNGGDCDYQSPVTAVNDVARVPGDIIDILTPVTYVLSETLQINKSITIEGNGSVFDANGIRAINVVIDPPLIGNLTLNNVTVRNGQAPAGSGGGAVSVSSGAALAVTGGIFENNQAEFGGAIHNNGSISVTLLESVFSGNQATAGEGGAILTDNGGNTTLEQVEVDGNMASVAGGGLAVDGDGSHLEIIASTIAGNAELLPIQTVSNPTVSGESVYCGPAAHGQFFVADALALSAFEFEIRLNGPVDDTGVIPDSLTIDGQVHSGGIFGPIIATAKAVAPGGVWPGGSTQALTFNLDKVLKLNLNEAYVIEMFPDGGYFTMLVSDVDYGGGDRYCGGLITEGSDWAFRTFGGTPGDNGGIYASTSSTVQLDTSTVSENLGDGIVVEDSTLESTFSTIGWNWGNGFTSVSTLAPAGGTFSSTIIADNGGDDCAPADNTSNGYNLIDDSTGCFTVPDATDQIGVNPVMAPLANNGGLTSTHALGINSTAAIDHGGTGCSGSLDQRGVARPKGLACDIGAFESVPALQSAIDWMDPGSVLMVEDGTYEELITIGDNKGLRARNPGNAVIDASNISIPGSVITATGSFSLEGITVTGGSSPGNGGGIYSDIDAAQITLTDVVFDNNHAALGGGAIFLQYGNLVGTNVTFTNNEALQGGAIHNSGSTININESLLSDNHSLDGDGGAILTDLGGSTTLSRTTVENNSANPNGGGLAVAGDGSELNVYYSTVSSNSAENAGAGIFVSDFSTVRLDTSTVSGNLGDGVLVAPSSFALGAFNTIAFNGGNGFTAQPSALVPGADVRFSASIIANNMGDDCNGIFTTQGYNLIGRDSNCTVLSVPPVAPDLIGVGELGIDPQLGELADNGGLTLTHAITADSPAVDAGGSGCIEDLDQRGVFRPVGDFCDIGAYEADAPLELDGPVILSVSNLGQHQLSNNTYPGVVDVPIIEIPIEKLTGGSLSSPESAPLGSFPLGSFPIGSFDLQNSPIGSFPIGSFPIGSFPIGSFPLGSFPLSSIPLLSEGGWSDILVGTELEGAPPQTVTLERVLRLDPLPGAVANIALRDLSIQGSPLASLSLRGLALGATTVADINLWLSNAGRTENVCDTLLTSDPSFTDCDPTTDTLLGLEMEGAPVSALSLSSLPLGSFPIGSFPIGSFPIGSFPLGSFPIGSFPIGSFPIGSFPLGSFPIGSFPIGSFPIGSFPIGSFPIGSFPIGSFPLGSFEIDGKSFCEFYDEQTPTNSADTCASLTTLTGFDPSTDNLEDLINALVASGASDIGSTPLGSFPMGSFPMGSFPLGSFPIGSFPIGSFPIGSFPIGSFPIGSFPIGSFPIGSFSFGPVPLSSFVIDGKSFCVFYDEQTPSDSSDTCAALVGVDPNTDSLDDLLAALEDQGASNIGSTPLGSFPMGSFPIGSFPIGSFGLADLPMSSVDINIFEINGAPLGSFPLGSFDLTGSPLGSFPIGSFAAVIDGACAGCLTLADAARAGVIRATATLADLAGSTEFNNLTLGDVLDAMTLAMIYGPGTLANIEDTGSLTLGQLLIAMMLKTDFPWETIPLDQLDAQEFSADHFVAYQVYIPLTGTVSEPFSVAVTLAESFLYVGGSAMLEILTAEESFPLSDPSIVRNEDGTQTLTFNLTLGGYTDNAIRFRAVPALALGDYAASAMVTLGTDDPVAADNSNSTMTVIPDPMTDIPDPEYAYTAPADILLLGFINTPDDNDYFKVAAPAAGNRVAVFMSNPAGDNDLIMYEPLSTVEAKGQTAESPALDSVPFEDDGVNFGRNLTEEPNALEDVNLAAAPLASISTNRGGIDESVSAVAGDTAPFTIQVSGYNGATSDQPYTLRVKVTPEVPVPTCASRTWPGSVASNIAPAGSWLADTNAVFLVNGDRLASSDPNGATGADAALTAINSLIYAPGITNGVVVDVSTIADYTAWDANPCDADAANDIVNSITNYLEAQRVGSPNLTYVTIVGSDEVIPFARKPDETSIANESTFAGEFSENAMYGALVTRHFLSDDTYGDIDPIAWLDRYLNVPELGVGRLVETAADIETAVANYLYSSGVLDPGTALSAGYDFIADASEDIDDTFNEYGPTLGFNVESALIDEPGVDPHSAWTRTDFLTATGLNTTDPVDQVSFNMHFDFDEALPSSGDAAGDYKNNLLNTTDLGTSDLASGIWFTVGCHSGTNVPDVSVMGSAPSEDWAQTFNRLGALYLAQNAYGLGDTEAVALTERLMANFARNLNGNLTIGQAHAFAKQQYFADLGLYGEYDYKALQAATLFGLPMYQYGISAVVAEPLPPALPVSTDPISGLASASWSLATTGITQTATSKGDLFSADGGVQFVHFRPLQPIVRRDVTSEDGKIASGAFLTRLVTEDIVVEDIAFARPVIDLGAIEPEVETDEVVFPTAFTNIANYKAPPPAGGQFAARQQLNVIVGQFTSPLDGGSGGTERLFREFDTQVFYRSASMALTSVTDDFVRPEFDNVQANVVSQSGAQQAIFSVDVTDANPVLRVAVLYLKSVVLGKGNWVLIDLEQGGTNTWTGGGPVDLSGIANGEVAYMVQAVDSNGNVANSTFKGLFYTAKETSTSVEVNGPTDPTVLGDLVTITGSVTDLPEFTEILAVDWGDDKISTATPDGGSFEADHLYTQPGVYKITVTVDYGNGAYTKTGVFEFAVIYDPSGGFVTGGGWFNSPSGAYTPGDSTDPDVVGRANFGFISKYKKGQSVPDGSTNFRFAAGNLVFNATVYDWMVISGANVRYKGEGTVNDGADLYKFMVTALDADIAGSGLTQDGFRIKIWQEGPGGTETVLYDNGLGVDESTGSGGTTALGGGSITIHKDRKK